RYRPPPAGSANCARVRGRAPAQEEGVEGVARRARIRPHASTRPMFGPIKKAPRLGQWDGRRHSSRSDHLVRSPLWGRPVLLRLGAVLATVVLTTVLAYAWGPPLPYRIGRVG